MTNIFVHSKSKVKWRGLLTNYFGWFTAKKNFIPFSSKESVTEKNTTIEGCNKVETEYQCLSAKSCK